jgi:hypothetical protein
MRTYADRIISSNRYPKALSATQLLHRRRNTDPPMAGLRAGSPAWSIRISGRIAGDGLSLQLFESLFFHIHSPS